MSTKIRSANDKAETALALVRQYNQRIAFINRKEVALKKQNKALGAEDVEARADAISQAKKWQNEADRWQLRSDVQGDNFASLK